MPADLDPLDLADRRVNDGTADERRLAVALLAMNKEAQRYRLALESLTPGGSEYHRNPERCVEFIQDAKREPARIVSQLRAEVDRLRDDVGCFERRADAAENALAAERTAALGVVAAMFERARPRRPAGRVASIAETVDDLARMEMIGDGDSVQATYLRCAIAEHERANAALAEVDRLTAEIKRLRLDALDMARIRAEHALLVRFAGQPLACGQCGAAVMRGYLCTGCGADPMKRVR